MKEPTLKDLEFRIRVLESICIGSGEAEKAVSIQTLVAMAIEARDKIEELEEFRANLGSRVTKLEKADAPTD